MVTKGAFVALIQSFLVYIYVQLYRLAYTSSRLKGRAKRIEDMSYISTIEISLYYKMSYLFTVLKNRTKNIYFARGRLN